jgi:FHA domain-containing protein
MLKLEVALFNGQPPAEPLSAEFDEMGGSIGRAEGNTLALPDEKRYISRTQADIAFRSGGYVLRDLGSATPTLVNGTAVGNGNEVALREGDEIRVGEYVLRVHVAGAAGLAAAPPATLPDDPFADLLGPAPTAQPPGLAAAAPAARQAIPFDDPFGLPSANAQPPAAQPGVIPADFDPFADLLPQSGASITPLPHELAPSPGQSVDDIFGLKSSDSWDPLGPQDPVAGVSGFGGALGTDPLAGFDSSPQRPAQPVQRDDAPMLSGAFQPPRPAPTTPPSPPPAAARPPAPSPSAPVRATPTGMVVSWDTPQSPAAGDEIKTVILPSPKRAAPQPPAQNAMRAAAVLPSAGAPMPAAVAPSPQPAPAHRAAPAPQSAVPNAAPDALLQAFLTGAGIADMRLPSGLTPELMNLVGELLHESIRGTLDLLLARALTKREVRAQATMIVARENNPLKFSPTVEAALNHLLAPQGQGFMAPASAMRDAYNDLRSHQFGFMAGMRAALEGVLTRFDPAQLESRLTRKGVLGSLVPSSRRARLWELYEQLYRDISKEAQDDFQTLFGKEFLRAYEAQIDKLEQEDAANKR